jgi:hypothetical protein
MKKLLWAVTGVVVLAEALSMHGMAAGFRIALIVLAVLLIVVLSSPRGFVLVIYRKRGERPPLLPAPDPELTARTRTTVTSVTVRPIGHQRETISLPEKSAPINPEHAQTNGSGCLHSEVKAKNVLVLAERPQVAPVGIQAPCGVH